MRRENTTDGVNGVNLNFRVRSQSDSIIRDHDRPTRINAGGTNGVGENKGRANERNMVLSTLIFVIYSLTSPTVNKDA